MNLAFSLNFPKEKDVIGGLETHFVPKILANFDQSRQPFIDRYVERLGSANEIEYFFQVLKKEPPKIHTIRRSKGRWRQGFKIHFEIGSRTAKRFQFAPVIHCSGTEEILIKQRGEDDIPLVSVDGMILDIDEITELAINDGFNNPVEFFAYFNKDFEGEIVHWTEKRYFDGHKISNKICQSIARVFDGHIVCFQNPETGEEMAMIKNKPKCLNCGSKKVKRLDSLNWDCKDCGSVTSHKRMEDHLDDIPTLLDAIGLDPKEIPVVDPIVVRPEEGRRPCDCWLENKMCKCSK